MQTREEDILNLDNYQHIQITYNDLPKSLQSWIDQWRLRGAVIKDISKIRSITTGVISISVSFDTSAMVVIDALHIKKGFPRRYQLYSCDYNPYHPSKIAFQFCDKEDAS